MTGIVCALNPVRSPSTVTTGKFAYRNLIDLITSPRVLGNSRPATGAGGCPLDHDYPGAQHPPRFVRAVGRQKTGSVHAPN